MKRPPTLQSRFKWLLLAVVMLALASYPIAEGDVGLLGFVLAAAVCGWIVTEHGKTRRGLPRWLSTLILIALLIAAVVRTAEGTRMVSAFAAFLSTIVVVKLWERREVRDYGQLLMMSLFLMIGAALTGTSVWLALVMAILTPLFVAAAMGYQLMSGAHRAGGEGAEVAWRPLRRAFIPLVFIATVAGLGIGVTVFVLVPRGVGLNELGSMNRPVLGRGTGFSDEVNLSQSGSISQSQATVMEVRISTETGGGNLGAEGLRQYLRGIVLDQYDRGIWTRDPSGTLIDRLEVGQVFTLGTAPVTGPIVVHEVTTRGASAAEVPLFGQLRPVSVQYTRLDGGVDIEFNPEASWVMQSGGSGRVSYRVRSAPAMLNEGDEGPPRGRVMFPSRAVQRLAREVLEDAGIDPSPTTREPPRDILAARALEVHVRDRCAYTLEGETVPLGLDPIEWFLITSRRGHCEHFASALAAMCRAVGVPARVVAGYLVSEFDAAQGVYIVRESNAHAWVEVLESPGRWVALDATPQSQLDALRLKQRGFWGGVGRMLDRMEEAWNQRIASFDENAQQRMFGGRGESQRWAEGVMEWIRGVAEPVTGAFKGGNWFGTGLLAGGVVMLGWVVLGVVRRWPARRRGTAETGWALDGRGLAIYKQLDAALTERGYRKDPVQPMESHLREVERGDPETGSSARAALEVLYRQAFAGETLTRQESDGAAALVRSIRAGGVGRR